MATHIAPFDAADYLDDEHTIAEYLTAALEDPNPDVFLTAVRDVGNELKLHEQRERDWHRETVEQVHRMHVEQARHEAAQRKHRETGKDA